MPISKQAIDLLEAGVYGYEKILKLKKIEELLAAHPDVIDQVPGLKELLVPEPETRVAKKRKPKQKDNQI